MKIFRKHRGLDIDEFLSDGWVRGMEVAELPIEGRVLFSWSLVVLILGAIILGRIFLLGYDKDFYKARAEANLSQVRELSAPRGMIFDTFGKVLAENQPVFLALLNVREFFQRKDLEEETLKIAREKLGVQEDEFWNLIRNNDSGVFQESIVLNQNLDQNQLIQLESLNLPTINVIRGFSRSYPEGPASASVIGYTGIVSRDDLEKYPNLGGRDFIGKAGIEAFYEDKLRGIPGRAVKFRDARGQILEEKAEEEPKIGRELHLTIDAEFQDYFYHRLEVGLRDLGRSKGVGLALDPRDGRILAMISLPSFDNNIFSDSKDTKTIRGLLNSSEKPMFNRAIAGLYSPGSTIKPLHALAALAEGVISPEREVFSPGFLDVPNPYSPDQPTRFLDWKYHGRVNLMSAIARSSNVYFYLVGGGSPPGLTGNEATYNAGIKGLGISRLRNWWNKFRLNLKTGIDLSGEVSGFLPDPEAREKKTGRPWLLGDTYNASIGQGDLQITPLGLLSYIGAIANGGKIYRPYLAKNFNQPQVLEDFSSLGLPIKIIQGAMARTVRATDGTAYLMHDLPFWVAGKTGSAQVKNKTEENAFFVGFASLRDQQNVSLSQMPEIAVLVLVENSKQGSLNAVPIAKDVLYWYYLHRGK